MATMALKCVNMSIWLNKIFPVWQYQEAFFTVNNFYPSETHLLGGTNLQSCLRHWNFSVIKLLSYSNAVKISC